MTRVRFYNQAKKLSKYLNVQMRIKYPRGTKVQWKNEVIRLREVERKLTRMRLEEEEKINLFRFFDEGKEGEFNVKYLKIQEAIKLVKFSDDNILLIKVGNSFRTITPENKNIINNTIEVFIDNQEEVKGSDVDYIIDIVDRELPFSFIIQKKVKESRKGGAFFKYLNQLDKVDLSRYGIFNTINKDNYKVNCFERAIINSVYGEELKDRIKLLMNKRHIPKKDLLEIAEKLEIHIVLNNLRNDNTTRITHYGSGNKIINVGLYDEHYFLIEKMNYTNFSIQNYFMTREVKGKNKVLNSEKDFNKIFALQNNKYKRGNRFISSLDIVKIMLNNKETHLKKIELSDGILSTTYYEKCNQIINLSINDNDCQSQENYDLKSLEKNTDIVYFDFEATTDEEIHKPFMICSETREGKKFYANGVNCALKWLQSLENDSLCIAHNLRYDLQFLLKYIDGAKKLIKTGNRIKSLEGKFYNKNLNKTINLKFKDSLAIISMPLSKFGKCFNLQQFKEVMPYDLYKNQDIIVLSENNSMKSIDEALFALQTHTEEEKNQFIDNCHKWNLIDENNQNFKYIEYAKIYCQKDVEVLKAGYEKFREWMFEVSRLEDNSNTGIDIDLVISIPQLAHKYMLDRGCFEDVYKLGGVPRAFIQKCVEGGRVMTADNKKIKSKGIKIQDFDGVSLYPSAMARFDGFLKGTPKVCKANTKYGANLSQINFNDIKNYDGYFVEIEIFNVPKKYKFPLITKKDENGIREYSNNLRGRGFYVDRYKLEDIIKFHELVPDIDFKIIRGYYFNEGYNKKVKEVIKNLFEERLKKKSEGNPIQEVYKLIMNASYGKLIMKPITEKFTFKYGDEKINKYLSYNYNTIKEYVKITDGMGIFKEIKPINNHFSSPHCGVPILSMSKRIMNEVMCLAEDLNIPMYYTDTDSIHINEDGIDLLNHSFQNKYNRKLIGKNLGQFHCDFDFKSDVRPVAIESIFLGKKTYIDKVQLFNNDVESYDYHIRCKGIPSKIIKEKGNPMEIYEKLYEGEKLEFDLISCCRFKSNSNFSMSNNNSFIRTLKF